MSTVIVFARPDGGVSVVTPGPCPEGTSAADWLAHVIARAVPDGARGILTTRAALPAYDSATRDRWVLDGDRVVIGPAAAVEPAAVPVRDELAALKAEVAQLRALQTGLIEAMQAAAQGGAG